MIKTQTQQSRPESLVVSKDESDKLFNRIMLKSAYINLACLQTSYALTQDTQYKSKIAELESKIEELEKSL